MYFSVMQKHVFLFCVICVLLSCTNTSNHRQSLQGVDWQFSPTVGSAQPSDASVYWQSATVPGNVQSDLLRLKKIPDPFLLNNEDSIQWVSEKDWMYKKTFSISSEILERQKHVLKFQGLDTYASISLNGSFDTLTNNAFRSYEFDVTEYLKETNTLEIVFSSPDKNERIEALKLDYELPESPRVFSRKPQFQYGWDWGPKIKTMGIWRDVSLVSYDVARLDDVYIETDSISKQSAILTAHITIDAVAYDNNLTLSVVNNTTGVVQERALELYGDKAVYDVPLHIENPTLWWTHNLGEPFLYDFTIALQHHNKTLDSVRKKIGIRTIELMTEKDSVGESFGFKLNGKPVYMKGANYIPQHIFLSDVRPKDRQNLLDDVVAANMNMLRVWGGGVYEDDVFYDLCDEKGILIWQDFMFACAMYPGDEMFLRTVKREAIDNIKRLRNHASIALWCGNNENSEGWHRWGWQTDKSEVQKKEIWSNYQKVFNEILPSVVDSLHSDISYWESSPKYGRGDKRYQFEGDAHDWWVWHDGYPFEHFEEEVPRFMSEFGFQSFPSYEAIQYFTQQEKIDLKHPSFATHQKHARGFKLIQEYMKRDFPVPTKDEDYVYVSQLLQAYGIIKGIKAHRRAKPYNMGTLFWQLNDCWPVVSWSSIDGLGNWKALHYKVMEAFENVSIIPFEEENKLKITIVDDNMTSRTAPISVQFRNFNGGLMKQFKSPNVTTSNSRNEVLFEVDLSTIKLEKAHMYVEISFGNKRAVHYFAKPKDLQLLAQDIEMTTRKTNEGLEIQLKTKTLQKDVFLYADAPGHFSNNFFDLMPGEEKIIQFIAKGKKASLITYKTLNEMKQNVQQLQ